MSGFASELHPLVDPSAERVCVGCGCTDIAACIDEETGEACAWVEGMRDADGPVNVCTSCAAVAEVLLLRWLEAALEEGIDPL